MIGLIAIIALIAMNGLFVAMEFVIVGSRMSRLEAASSNGAAIAKTLDGPEAQDRYVAVAQLGVTLASIGLGMYGEHKIVGWLEAPLSAVGIEGAAVHVVALTLGIVLLTYFHVVLGEMIPKAMALKGAEGLLLSLWPLVRFFEFVFRPLVALLNIISQSLLSLFGLDQSDARFYTRRELAGIAEDSGESGEITPEQADFIRNIVRMQGRCADELMTTRGHVISLDLDRVDDKDLVDTILTAGPSRLPVTRGGLDHALGVVHVKDIIHYQTENDTRLDAATLEGLLRPLPRTLSSVDSAALLDNMRRHQSHMALVVDEYGSVLGTVAFETVIAQVVGESDSGLELEAPDAATDQGQRWKIPGTTPITRLREELDWAPEASHSRTIAGLLLEHLRRVPSVGDICEIEDFRFRVEAIEGLSIAQISAERLHNTATVESEDAS